MAGIVPEQIKPRKTLADIPVIKAFVVRHPSASAESIRKFYDTYFELKQDSSTLKMLSEQGEINEAMALLEEMDLINLEQTYRALSNQHDIIEYIYQNPEIASDEKRQLIDAVYYQMIEIAAYGNELIKILKEELK